MKPSYPSLCSDFNPAYTPIEMMEMGVFCGGYFRMAKPEDFMGMNSDIREMAATQQTHNVKLNCFLVSAGLPYSDWLKKGWIVGDDRLGWFHWYCRFYSGRRSPWDSHQINRHRAYVRWKRRAQIQFSYEGRISSVIMQGLLQWSYDPLCFSAMATP